MSTNTTSSSDARQQAIELRLDAIDRALLGLLSRKERLDLVSQIETKLREAAAASPSIDAELAESSHGRADAWDKASEAALSSLERSKFSPRRRPKSRLAVSSGILGIVALVLLIALPVVYFVAMMMGDEFLTISLLGGHVAAVTLGGLLAVVLGVTALVILNRREGRLFGHGWAITGLCTGPLPALVGGLVALVLGVELLPTLSVTPVYTASTVPAPGPTGVPPSYASVPQAVPNMGYPAPTSYAPGAPSPDSPYSSQPSAYPPGSVPAGAAPYGATPDFNGPTSAPPAVPNVGQPPVPPAGPPPAEASPTILPADAPPPGVVEASNTSDSVPPQTR